MSFRSKRYREMDKLRDKAKSYSVAQAIEILKQCPPTKFDQSVEVAIKLGIDPRKSDQQVRGTVSLPNGTGKKITVLVLAQGNKVAEALAAGADYAGSDEYIEKIKNGWTEVSVIIATPDMMREVGKLGKVLGPRGLMPTPKAGTVTNDVGQAVKEVKAGKVEFKGDKSGVINNSVGKLSFTTKQLEENVIALAHAINRAKPSTAKGVYMVSISLSSTMGIGMKIDTKELSV